MEAHRSHSCFVFNNYPRNALFVLSPPLRASVDEPYSDPIMDDLVIDIISCLPVKDLMRFTSVSKSWLSLISSDLHLSNLQLQCESTDQPLVVLQREESTRGAVFSRKYYNYQFDMDSLEDPSVDLVKVRNPFHVNYPLQDAKVVASFDGLLVLQQAGTRSFALLNPSTRKCHLVPPNPDDNENVVFSGFGRGSDLRCYKLVTTIKPKEGDTVIVLMIYDVNGTWRKIQHFWPTSFPDNPAICVNNVLYWHENSPDEESLLIIGFDLDEEEFFAVEPPDFGDDHCMFVQLTAFNGVLCLVCMWENFHWRAEFYLMNEAENCWLELFSISDVIKTLLNEPDGAYIQLLPLYLSASRKKVLFNVHVEGDDVWFKQLVWYDLPTSSFEYISNPVNEIWSTDAIICARSLVGNGMF